MKKSTSRSQRVERTDLYQQVTDRIVAALEKRRTALAQAVALGGEICLQPVSG